MIGLCVEKRLKIASNSLPQEEKLKFLNSYWNFFCTIFYPPITAKPFVGFARASLRSNH